MLLQIVNPTADLPEVPLAPYFDSVPCLNWIYNSDIKSPYDSDPEPEPEPDSGSKQNRKDAPKNTSPQPPKRKKAILPYDVVPFTGDLNAYDQSRIASWISQHVPGAQGNQQLWMSKAPFAHAINLVIAKRRHDILLRELVDSGKVLDESDLEGHIIHRAWRFQTSDEVMQDANLGVDVDRECLLDLERRMFTRSLESGEAGYYQWGLDAGDHQDKWDPYRNLPSGWFHSDAVEYSDELLEV